MASSECDILSAENSENIKPNLMKEKKSKKKKKTPTFIGQMICACKNKCFEKIDILRQKEIFDQYNELPRNKKILLLRKIVVQRSIGKENINPIQQKKREFKCEHFLPDDKNEKHKVCQTFVLKLLQVSRTTLFRAVKSAKSNPNAIDKRGKFPAKRIDARVKLFIHNFITELPVYESKYNTSESSAKFLHPGVNRKQIYMKFKEKLPEIPKIKKPVSFALFNRIFNNEFKLILFKNDKKKCYKCQRIEKCLQKKIISENRREELMQKKDDHVNLVKKVNQEFFDAVEMSQSPTENTVVLVFNFGVPIDIPSMNLVKDITKRRLWLHNFCIFDETHQKECIYVWPESAASNGPEEIGSCINKYFMENLPGGTKKVILYSPSEFGQHRNVTLSLMLKKLLYSWPHAELKTIEQRFFVKGHGYSKCNRSLESIHDPKKVPKNIWTTLDWYNKTSKEKHFIDLIHEMHANDFFSAKDLENLIFVRKISDQNRQIQWSSFQKLIYQKEKFFELKTITYDSFENLIIFHQTHTDATFDVDLSVLNPNGLCITKKKFLDLQFLTKHYIPPEFHSFYNGLKYADNDDDKDYALCNSLSSDDDEEEDGVFEK